MQYLQARKKSDHLSRQVKKIDVQSLGQIPTRLNIKQFKDIYTCVVGIVCKNKSLISYNKNDT